LIIECGKLMTIIQLLFKENEMAPISYYYLISVAITGGALYWLANLLFLKFLGRAIFGQVYKKGTPEHSKMVELSNWKSISISCAIAAVIIANLCLSIVTVLNFDLPDKYGLLIGVAIFAVIFFAVAIAIQHNQYRIVDTDDDKYKK